MSYTNFLLNRVMRTILKISVRVSWFLIHACCKGSIFQLLYIYVQKANCPDFSHFLVNFIDVVTVYKQLMKTLDFSFFHNSIHVIYITYP